MSDPDTETEGPPRDEARPGHTQERGLLLDNCLLVLILDVYLMEVK